METKPQPTTIDDKLRAMRSGYKFAKEITYGEFTFPVRVLTADEETRIYAESRIAVSKMIGLSQELLDAEIPKSNMKHLLMHASTINGTQYLPMSLLNHLSSSELQALYEKYLDIICEVDPEFTNLTQLEINEIITEVKKSPDAVRGLSTRQLKGIGAYFLEQLLPMVSRLGGS